MFLKEFDFLLLFFSARINCSVDVLKDFTKVFLEIKNISQSSLTPSSEKSSDLYNFFHKKSLNFYFSYIESFPDFSICTYTPKAIYGNDPQNKSIEVITQYILQPQKKGRDVFFDFTCLANDLWRQYIDIFLIYAQKEQKNIPEKVQNFIKSLKEQSLDQENLYLKKYFQKKCTGIFQTNFL